MWRTQCGERILEGAEARVFAESLSSLLDNAIVDQFEDYESDVVGFDNLTYGQKISVLGSNLGLFRPTPLKFACQNHSTCSQALTSVSITRSDWGGELGLCLHNINEISGYFPLK